MRIDSRFFLVSTVLGLAFFSGALRAADSLRTETYFVSHAFAYSPAIAASAFSSDWHDTFFGGTKALAFLNKEIGAQFQHIGLAYYERQHYSLQFDEETARLYYQTENKLPLNAGTAYAVDIRFQQFSYRALKLFFVPIQNNRFSVNVSVNLIKPQKLLDGKLSGTVIATNNNDHDYADMHLDYFYSRDLLFKRSTEVPVGAGYSMDINAHWRVDDKLKLQWQAYDVFGYIDWRQAPHTVAMVSSDNKHFDENGYAIIDPAFSGDDENVSFHQRLPLIQNFTASLRIAERATLIARILTTPIHAFPQLGVETNIDSMRAGIHYGLNTGALSLSLENQWLQFRIASDAINFHHARTFEFAAGVNLILF